MNNKLIKLLFSTIKEVDRSKFNKVIECRCSFETTADSVSEMAHSYINYELTFEELSVDSKFKIDVHNAMVTQYQNISLKRFKGDQ